LQIKIQMDSANLPCYNLNEQIYESSDKSIKMFKTRKRYTIQYIAVKIYNKKVHGENASFEYQILKNLNHPNIVKCLGYTEDFNYFYMELEYCITGDLSKCLWQNKNSHVIY
jgi:serine/threonine protein kinase